MDYLFSHRRYRLALRAAVRTAHGAWTEREGVIVRLEADAKEEGRRRKEESSADSTGSPHAGSGLGRRAVGFGEAAVIPWFGTETVDEVEAACRELGGRVNDARLDGLPARLRCLRNAIAAARAEVVAACGGPERRVKDNAPYLPVAALLPAGRGVLGAIAPKAEAGFRVFKWKVGVGDVADELALLDDVCAALPSGAKLRLDANGAWDRRKAERWLERCAERPVEFVEQPVAADAKGAVDLLLGLAGDFPTAVALDESVASDDDVARWIEAGWAGIFVVKPSLLGDVAGTLARLEAAKADVVFSSALETAVGARAALRAAFAWARSTGSGQAGEIRALGFGVWPLYADARFDGPHAAAFIRAEDVERIDAEVLWSALS